jgi:hypothetical protein
VEALTSVVPRMTVGRVPSAVRVRPSNPLIRFFQGDVAVDEFAVAHRPGALPVATQSVADEVTGAIVETVARLGKKAVACLLRVAAHLESIREVIVPAPADGPRDTESQQDVSEQLHEPVSYVPTPARRRS